MAEALTAAMPDAMWVSLHQFNEMLMAAQIDPFSHPRSTASTPPPWPSRPTTPRQAPIPHQALPAHIPPRRRDRLQSRLQRSPPALRGSLQSRRALGASGRSGDATSTASPTDHPLTHPLTDMIVITGPTASGKTARAVHLARAIGGEIVSADSRQNLPLHGHRLRQRPRRIWRSALPYDRRGSSRRGV